jgi:hypothetical protein
MRRGFVEVLGFQFSARSKSDSPFRRVADNLESFH